MPNKLENLDITKVAFVPAGDNPKANVMIFKSKTDQPPEEGVEKRETTMKKVFVAIAKAFGFGENDAEQAATEHIEATETAKAKKELPTDESKGKADNSPVKPQCKSDDTDDDKDEEEELTDMKIDKSKLSPEELTQLEAIEKKAGVPDRAEQPDGGKPEKKRPPKGDENKDDTDDIYKGLHPAVKAEIERLRKAADDAEERELTEIAKKYSVVGKKPEELVPAFKALKAAGGNAYDQMIAVLDASVTAFEKSGLFQEVGKRGNGDTDAWAAIEKKAEEIMKAAPTITRAQAIEKACEQNPDLVRDYEESR